MVVPVGLQTRALVQLLEEQSAGGKPYKVILFFATARQTAYYSEILQNCGFNVLEMHSRKSQPYRNRVSDEFRKGNNMILASSDVSARGMDYPGVSFVLQVGLDNLVIVWSLCIVRYYFISSHSSSFLQLRLCFFYVVTFLLTCLSLRRWVLLRCLIIVRSL
jgi:hypothetical protein